MTDVTMLYSEAAEAAVIGGILSAPKLYDTIAGILTPDTFFLLRNQYIFRAMAALKQDGLPIDYLTVSERLRLDGKLAEVTPAYLTQAINDTPNSHDAPNYAKLVKLMAGRRALLSFADGVKSDAMDGGIALTDVLARASRNLLDVQQRSEIQPPYDLARELNAFWDDVERQMSSPDEFAGIPTGYHELDRCINGLRPGQLVIVGARPGMGKSALLTSMALNLISVKPTARIVLFSAEMKKREVIQRLVSAETGLSIGKLINGKLNESDHKRFVAAMGRIANFNLRIDDTPNLTPDRIRATCNDMVTTHGGIDLVLVDYVQLMTVPGIRRGDRVAEVSECSRALKVAAGDFNVPVVSAAQLSRAVEMRQDKRPQLSDLRESGTLEQDGDLVMFLYRGDYYKEPGAQPGVIELNVAKQRNGDTPTEPFELIFQKDITRIVNGKHIRQAMD